MRVLASVLALLAFTLGAVAYKEHQLSEIKSETIDIQAQIIQNLESAPTIASNGGTYVCSIGRWVRKTTD